MYEVPHIGLIMQSMDQTYLVYATHNGEDALLCKRCIMIGRVLNNEINVSTFYSILKNVVIQNEKMSHYSRRMSPSAATCSSLVGRSVPWPSSSGCKRQWL